MRITLFRFLLLPILLSPPLFGREGGFPLRPLTDGENVEVRRALSRMKENPRGPFQRLRWFCNDGTVHAPQGTPCRERGGGHQYAEPSRTALRLAELDFHVVTFLQALSYDRFLDAGRDHHRLRELVVQQYLLETDDGWVLRRARYYRGARQIEDEQHRGDEFLEKLFSDPDWTARNFLLASQLVAVVPHSGQAGASNRRVRNLVQELAEMDESFHPLRVKIHAFPSAEDLETVEERLRLFVGSELIRSRLIELRDALRAQYADEELVPGLREFAERLSAAGASSRIVTDVGRLERALSGSDVHSTVGRLAALCRDLRLETMRGRDGGLNLLLMDLKETLEQKAFLLAGEGMPGRSRLEKFVALEDYFLLAFSSGFLSARELDALTTSLNILKERDCLPVREYRRTLNYLSRSLDWAAGVSRQTFGTVFQRYLLVEERVGGFFDALVRGSNLLHLGAGLAELQRDADELLRRSDAEFSDEAVVDGFRALNPGVAVGRLRVVSPLPRGWRPDPMEIHVIPELVADLTPVAGLVTVDAGNLLSHVQLLARALQIPNATAPVSAVERLRAMDGAEVFYVVSPLGRIILKPLDRLTSFERHLLERLNPSEEEFVKLDTSRLRLDRIAPVPLENLRASDSGVVAGPKAANLGELAVLFPGKVAKGVVLPFGLYHRHVNRPFEGEGTLLEQIRDAFRTAEEMGRSGASQEAVNRFMFPRLARFRDAILSMDWIPEDRRAVVKSLEETFGLDLPRGVFVRSDTNVEDLPKFSGAGLNLTAANQRTVDAVLLSVLRLWASPFSERAYLWRRRVLGDVPDVFPSVLILESVPSEKSGVMVTMGLDGGDTSRLTLATAEGVGGAVEGEAAETLEVTPDGGVRLLSQARAPFRRVLDPESGGMVFMPASREDYLLSAAEIAELREVAALAAARFPSAEWNTVWDIEFGFSQGRLWLFQIRPFIPFGDERELELLREIDAHHLTGVDRELCLEIP
jgi:hypothetical protein